MCPPIQWGAGGRGRGCIGRGWGGSRNLLVRAQETGKPFEVSSKSDNYLFFNVSGGGGGGWGRGGGEGLAMRTDPTISIRFVFRAMENPQALSFI